MKLIVSLVVALVTASVVHAGENLGQVSGNDLMRIGGNNAWESEQYNFVVVLRLRAHGEQFRAIGDVEAHASRVGDSLFRIASVDNLVIATIKSPGSYGNVQSNYARASRLTTLCAVYDYEPWAYGERTSKVIFGERPVHTLCN